MYLSLCSTFQRKRLLSQMVALTSHASLIITRYVCGTGVVRCTFGLSILAFTHALSNIPHFVVHFPRRCTQNQITNGVAGHAQIGIAAQ